MQTWTLELEAKPRMYNMFVYHRYAQVRHKTRYMLASVCLADARTLRQHASSHVHSAQCNVGSYKSKLHTVHFQVPTNTDG